MFNDIWVVIGFSMHLLYLVLMFIVSIKCHLLSSKLRRDKLQFFGYFLLLFLGRIF